MLRDFAVAALFVSSFLYLFKPFGLDRIEQHLLPFCIGYGVVTFVAGVSYEWFLQHLLKVKTDVPSWTLWKWIISSLGLLLWIAIANIFYSSFIYSWVTMSPASFSMMLSQTVLVGIFPTAFFGLVRQLRANQANQLTAESLAPSLDHSANQFQAESSQASDAELAFGDNDSPQLMIKISSLQYVEAMQNYVAVHYVREGQPASDLIRQTLSATEAEIAKVCTANEVLRCHRSFLVNVSKIEKVSGNAQGLRLRLSDLEDTEIPVSRSYIPALRSLLS